MDKCHFPPDHSHLAGTAEQPPLGAGTDVVPPVSVPGYEVLASYPSNLTNLTPPDH